MCLGPDVITWYYSSVKKNQLGFGVVPASVIVDRTAFFVSRMVLDFLKITTFLNSMFFYRVR